MKIMCIETIEGREHMFPVSNNRHAAMVLMNLQRVGVLCKRWWYEEMKA